MWSLDDSLAEGSEVGVAVLSCKGDVGRMWLCARISAACFTYFAFRYVPSSSFIGQLELQKSESNSIQGSQSVLYKLPVNEQSLIRVS